MYGLSRTNDLNIDFASLDCHSLEAFPSIQAWFSNLCVSQDTFLQGLILTFKQRFPYCEYPIDSMKQLPNISDKVLRSAKMDEAKAAATT